MKNEELQKEWKRRVGIFKASGMTQTKWCEANDVNIHQLKYWLKRFKASTNVQETNSKWVPITIEEDKSSHDKNDGVAALVQQEFELDPFSPNLFVFCNKQRDRISCFLFFPRTRGCLAP